jgi:hypothetical protein
MSFVEDIRVNLSVRLASGTVKKIRAICGLGLEKPLANYDPNTRSWKMYEATLVSEDCPSLENLPPSGMTRNGVLFLQRPWEPITNGIESLSWPTELFSTATITESAWNPKPETVVGQAVTRPMEKVEAGEMTEAEAEAILGKSVWEAQGKLPAMWPQTSGLARCGPNMADTASKGRWCMEEREAFNNLWFRQRIGFGRENIGRRTQEYGRLAMVGS